MLERHHRRTKLIWSFETECLNEDLTTALPQTEFDALRIVYHEGRAEKILKFFEWLNKKKSGQDSKRYPIMIDIATKVRAHVTDLKEPKELPYGKIVHISSGDGDGEVKVASSEWESLFKVGENVFFGYGYVVLKVLSMGQKSVEAQVVQGGVIYPHMEIHVPATRKIFSLSEVPKADLCAFLKMEVDYLIVSGSITSDEVNEIRSFCQKEKASLPWIILKLNSKSIYQNLEQLIDNVHGVFISRMELALTMEPASIPIITKEVIQLCNDRAKLVFTASEMLGSMRYNVTPTRAEVSDIANAVSDGADAVALSEEIPYGRHAQRAIELMRKIVDDVEEKNIQTTNWLKHAPGIENEMDAVSSSAYKTAVRVDAKAIVCLTREGNTAVKLASFRTTVPIIAVAFSTSVMRKLSLVHGVNTVILNADPLIDQVLPVVNDSLKTDSWLKKGDRYVFVTVTLSPLGQQASNLFTIQTIK